MITYENTGVLLQYPRRSNTATNTAHRAMNATGTRPRMVLPFCWGKGKTVTEGGEPPSACPPLTGVCGTVCVLVVALATTGPGVAASASRSAVCRFASLFARRARESARRRLRPSFSLCRARARAAGRVAHAARVCERDPLQGDGEGSTVIPWRREAILYKDATKAGRCSAAAAAAAGASRSNWRKSRMQSASAATTVPPPPPPLFRPLGMVVCVEASDSPGTGLLCKSRRNTRTSWNVVPVTQVSAATRNWMWDS